MYRGNLLVKVVKQQPFNREFWQRQELVAGKQKEGTKKVQRRYEEGTKKVQRGYEVGCLSVLVCAVIEK